LRARRATRRTTPTDKGKPVERRGRKATGLRDEVLRQRGCQRPGTRHPLPRRAPASATPYATDSRTATPRPRLSAVCPVSTSPATGGVHDTVEATEKGKLTER